MKLPVICIIGRPNVGKSSLFNRILGRRAAVVSDRDGVTRDRHYQNANFKGHEFTIVDTGGFLPDDTIDVLADSVRAQIFNAVNESDLVLFMVDIRVGVTALDQQFARIVRRMDKKVILVANKSESASDRNESYEFLKLGFGQPRTISALTGYACLSLLDEIVTLLPTAVKGPRKEERPIRFAILGRPNAGKSTLLNRLLNEDRAVVSDIPGTTRDSIDCNFVVDGQKFVVTDTAGLRKKAKVEDEVEIFSNMRTLESVRRSDVSVLMVDCTRGLEVQDFRIITEIRKSGKGLVLVLNKWDILPNKNDKSFDHMVKEMLEREPMLEYVPILSISAKEGQRVSRVVQAIQTVYANCRRVLGRQRVAEAFQNFLEQNPCPTHNARAVMLTRACQIMVEPPVIAIETRTPELVDESYKRYLLKKFYDEFQLQGAPLRLNFDQKLTLRKDEELEQFTESSNSVSVGVNPQRDMGSKTRQRKELRHS
ncbi:MAG: ribosome biogenesis GTPase Der [Fibrobacteraceae bacterium]|nr:ribosome biogenesis GTPase Der [Fibrobacteraceae bacterium]